MSRTPSRREFLIGAAGTAAGLAAADVFAAKKKAEEKPAPAPALPTRVLGKTGVRVSMLGFGGGSRFLLSSDDEAVALLDRAVAAGITYFDTADSYGKDRRSEKLYGLALPKHRKGIFLANKTQDRTYDGAMRSVEQGLKLLNVDSLDLIQAHDVGPRDDIEAWDKPGGVIAAFRKMKDEKITRFIGFTGHQDAAVHKKVIESFDLDTVLMALNAAKHKRFAELALPAAVEKGMGVIAMKVARDLVGEGTGKATIADLLQHTFDLPITTAIVGMESVQNLEDNVRIAREYKASDTRTAGLAERLQAEVTPTQLSWAQPGYRDQCV
jgi:uncharacterized protein